MRVSSAKREFAIQLVQKGLSQRVVANKLHKNNDPTRREEIGSRIQEIPL